MKRSTPILFLFFAAAMSSTLSGCLDGFETDKIDSEVELSPSVLVPMATSSLSIEYLFDEKDNAIQYYVADDEDGTNRIKLYSEREKSISVSLFDLMGLGASQAFNLGTLDLSDVDFEALKLTGQTKVSRTFTVELPLCDTDAMTIYSLSSRLKISSSWSGFSRPMSMGIGSNGVLLMTEVVNDGAKEVEGDMTFVPSAGKLAVSIVCEGDIDGDGKWGSIDINLSLSETDNVVCSTTQISANVGPSTEATNMGSFKNLSKAMYFQNPRLWMTCENSTPFDITIAPQIISASEDDDADNSGMTLAPSPLSVLHRMSGEEELNRSNSTIAEMLHPVPDYLNYTSAITLSMPTDVVKVTVMRSDSVFLGFRYDIPFDFIMDGELSDDKISISDVPENSNIEEAKLIITSDNTMPFEFSIKATFIERGTGNYLSTINIPTLIGMPQLSEWGTSIGEMTHNVTTVTLSEKNIEDLQNSKAILFVTEASSNGRYVAPKLEDKANIDIALAVKFEFSNK